MPDGDVIASRVSREWRSSLARLRGGGSPEEIVPHLTRALTATLRSNGGIAAVDKYGALVDTYGRRDISAAAARAEARTLFREGVQTPFAMTVHRAVTRLLVSADAPSDALKPGATKVTEAVCAELVNNQLFERVRPNLVGDCFPDHTAFDTMVRQCNSLLSPSIDNIVASLARDPSASSLRASAGRRSASRQATAAILSKSIL